MQNLIWLGNEYFARELDQCGWENVHIHTPRLYKPLSFNALADLAGFEPDVLVVADMATPPLLLGVEDLPCLTIFYSVNSHHNSWYGDYAQAFDACLVSLRDHIGRFHGPFMPPGRVWWSPPFAPSSDLPMTAAKKAIPCLFAGRDDAKLMPKRHKFLQELQELVPELIIGGNDHDLFPCANVVVNQAECGALTFDVFEAMGCGSCLVTPRIGQGLETLFVDGEQYVGYADGDAGDAAYRINFLLERPELCRHIGEAAAAEIDGKHRARHRAEAFTDHVCDLAFSGPELVQARIANAPDIRKGCLASLYQHWANELPGARKAFLAAIAGQFGLNGS